MSWFVRWCVAAAPNGSAGQCGTCVCVAEVLSLVLCLFDWCFIVGVFCFVLIGVVLLQFVLFCSFVILVLYYCSFCVCFIFFLVFYFCFFVLFLCFIGVLLLLLLFYWCLIIAFFIW